MEQIRVDFQFRQGKLEEYVRRHESGDLVSWPVLLVEKGNLGQGTESFRSAKTPRKPVPREFVTSPPPSKRKVNVPALIFDKTRKAKNIVFLNDNTTMTSTDDDRGGSAVTPSGITMGLTYWEATIEQMWDSSASEGSIRFGVVIKPNYDVNHAIGDDLLSLAWWDSTIDGHVFQVDR